MMREIAGDLATLAAHLPIDPSRKARGVNAPRGTNRAGARSWIRL
jgi:hypothetical protein